MLDMRDLECLSALARCRHFARAAEECGLSQPAFSMRIRNLEERLSTQIVKRGNRYQGLTAEGEIVLARGRDILGHIRSLEEEVQSARGDVSGPLNLGVIPTAAAYAARIASTLRASHPGIRMRVYTTNSLNLQQGLEDGRFDAALSYTEGVASTTLRVEELYEERYVLMLPRALHKGQEAISWADAAALPLILLEPEMQNRRILDQVFADAGVAPTVVAETDGFTATLFMAAEGLGAAVLPEVLVENLGQWERVVVVPLVDPETARSVSLITSQRRQTIPVIEALRSVLL
ncbi:MAG: LysR family transcriptional regulator [Pseudomonadota bacterium]